MNRLTRMSISFENHSVTMLFHWVSISSQPIDHFVLIILDECEPIVRSHRHRRRRFICVYVSVLCFDIDNKWMEMCSNDTTTHNNVILFINFTLFLLSPFVFGFVFDSIFHSLFFFLFAFVICYSIALSIILNTWHFRWPRIATTDCRSTAATLKQIHNLYMEFNGPQRREREGRTFAKWWWALIWNRWVNVYCI